MIVLCLESDLLVFIDQHAADERVRLEQLSKGTCVRISHLVIRALMHHAWHMLYKVINLTLTS